MVTNTTLSLPEELVTRAKSYAAAHGTTITAIIRQHLTAVTATDADPIGLDPLLAYSQGHVASNTAVRLLGLRDHADLLVLMGDADLPMPMPPASEIEAQAQTFVELWTGP